MAKPIDTPSEFSATVNYTGGPDVGTPTKVNPGAAQIAEGWRKDDPAAAQGFNFLWGQWTRWLRWLAEGTSAPDATAHLIETDAAGQASIRTAALGTPTTDINTLTIAGTSFAAATAPALIITQPVTSNANAIEAISYGLGVAMHCKHRANKGAIFGDGSDSGGTGYGVWGQGGGSRRGVVGVGGSAGVGGTGGTSGAGVEGTGGGSLGVGVAGISAAYAFWAAPTGNGVAYYGRGAGTGRGADISGGATADYSIYAAHLGAGSAIRGQTRAAGVSTDYGLRGVGIAAGRGVLAEADSGIALVATSTTGSAVFATSGANNAKLMDTLGYAVTATALSADPGVDPSEGQGIYFRSISTVEHLKVRANALDRIVHTSSYGRAYAVDVNSSGTIAENAGYTAIASVTLLGVELHTVTTVIARASVLLKRTTLGNIPELTAAIARFQDVTAGAVFFGGGNIDCVNTAAGEHWVMFQATQEYTLPATGTRTFEFEIGPTDLLGAGVLSWRDVCFEVWVP